MRFYGRQLAEAVMVLVLMVMFSCLPVDWASALGSYIGRMLGPRLGASRRALHNLRRVMPENTDGENRRIVVGMWDNLGRSVAEYPHLGRICSPMSGRVEIVNEAEITDLLAGGRPAILFGGHFANWEVGPATVHRLMGASLLSVYRAANNPLAGRLLRHQLRARHAVPKGAEAGRALIRHLRGGGHVAMLVDQKQNDGVAVPFFGRDAMTAPAAVRLALRFGCPLVPVVVERRAGARFRVTVMPAIEVYKEAPDIRATMTQVNAVIEAWVRARPEQWLWIHRRWPDETASGNGVVAESARTAPQREPAMQRVRPVNVSEGTEGGFELNELAGGDARLERYERGKEP